MPSSPAADPAPPIVDLRRAALADVRALDLRSSSRDFWSDEAAIFDRTATTWAGLDEAAWHLPGAAKSDAGGADWSLAEHVGHLADWQELAIDYVGTAIQTGAWPSDDDYDGGDFDRFNERRRAPWTTMPSTSIVRRLSAARPRLLEASHRLPLETIRGDAAWGWVYMTLHGHYLDHLAVIEPWTDALLARQADGDPFVADPRAADHDGFLAAATEIDATFDALVRRLPFQRWDAAEVTPGWTVRDHVGHLADWMDEGARAIAMHASGGDWLADPDEAIDAWNDRHVAATRGESPADTLRRYDAAHGALAAAVRSMSIEDLRSPDGWSWAYDCHHGHVRKHLAMVGRWCVQAGPEA
ncbi:MAG TPA: maleylpyruvate isomerase N-terminal domain-containing protein [Candidatus Limnocylindrales bacterium]|nr:maleylpyruvate isomerase N-terminal domain-containing protein [Candidatus Limnocylindrales bacterium]